MLTIEFSLPDYIQTLLYSYKENFSHYSPFQVQRVLVLFPRLSLEISVLSFGQEMMTGKLMTDKLKYIYDETQLAENKNDESLVNQSFAPI